MTDAGRFLLVDDDTVFSGVLERGLIRRGYTTCCVSSADSALQACSDFAPSHILLDLNMPGTSGLVVLPKLLARAPDARLVILTGYSSIATTVDAIKAGASNYLCKPASMDEILRAFDETPAVAEVPEQPPSVERIEWEHIQRVLAENEGNISATARALNMHRRTLQRKLQKKPVRR
ncbi:MAG: response regulator [Pseudomonadota bacterium]